MSPPHAGLIDQSPQTPCPEGVALFHKSRWPSLTPGGSNINILNLGLRTDIGESTAVHGLEVELVTA